MNAKTAKTIRRLSKDLKLSYDLQKSVFKRLSIPEQRQYLKDAKININDARNDRIEKSYKE